MGAIVVDEVIVPIVDIYLTDGRIYFRGVRRGPAPAVDTDSYSVQDQHGRGVLTTRRGITGLSWPAVAAGATLTVIVPLTVLDSPIPSSAARR